MQDSVLGTRNTSRNRTLDHFLKTRNLVRRGRISLGMMTDKFVHTRLKVALRGQPVAQREQGVLGGL